MIPELIKGHGRASGSFRYCLRYVLRKQANPSIIASNMIEETPERLASEFEFITPASGKGKDLVFHYALSFAPEDVPKLKDPNGEWRVFLLREMGERSLNQFGELAQQKRGHRGEIGLNTEDNQYLIIFHPPREEGDLPHLHIVANRARFDGKLCYCSWGKNDLHSAAALIEAEFDLRRCDHGKSKREAKKSGEKDPRELSPRQLKRLEKKEQRTEETDPRLAAYRELMEEQRQRLEQLSQSQQDEPVNSSGETEPVANTQVQPTLHQQVELPAAAIHLSSEQQRQVAQDNYRTLWLIFQQAKGLWKAKEIAPGCWVYEDKKYAFAYNSSKQLFSVGHRERGLLARYQSRKLLEVGKIEPEDIEAFAKYEQSREQPLPSTSLRQRGKSQWELG